MRSRIRSNIVVVGIAPWGVIQGRDKLKGQNVNIYSLLLLLFFQIHY